MKRAILLPLALAACSHHRPPMPVFDPAKPCQTATVEFLIGKPGSAILAADALRRSNARVIRFIRPKQAVTLEFLGDRLNIMVDKHGIVKSFSCG